MTFYWTDICLLLVLSLATLSILLSLRKASALRIYQQIFQKPFALSASIVLVFFILIGVLDCIRLNSYQDASKGSNTITVLDKILAPLNTVYEKTYAAPFALTLYTAETIMEKDKKSGSMIAHQVHLRLLYPPIWIKDYKMVRYLVFTHLSKGFFLSLFITFIFSLGILGLQRSRKVSKKMFRGLLTFFFCLFFVIATYQLSRYFHLFGTGKIGQDIFYYTVKSIRTGLVIGLLTTIFMLPLAIFFGITAGYFGGFIDDVIQYIYTTLSSIPGILLITASVLSLQTYMTNHPLLFPTLEAAQDARLLALCFILGITSWTSLCRLLRAEALKYREMDFVQAAIALGSNSAFILRKHLLPNVLPIILITLVLDFSFLVLAEALLAYVGVGVSPMTISWGNMINSARLELAKDPIVWWPVVATFIFMFTLVLASNLFADAVRDALDPNQAD